MNPRTEPEGSASVTTVEGREDRIIDRVCLFDLACSTHPAAM